MKNLFTVSLFLFSVIASSAQLTLQDGSGRVIGLASESSINADANNPDNTSDCYNTVETLFANNGDELIENGDNVTFVASETIIFSDGFRAKTGSSVHAYIVSDKYCPEQAESLLANQNDDLETNNNEDASDNSQSVLEDFEISIYPNPTNGIFYIDFLNQSYTDAKILILDLRGQLLQNLNPLGKERIEVDLSRLPKGTYLIVIKHSERVINRKVVSM